MHDDKLVKMANEIASFFESDPDRKAAEQGIAGHLKRFWAPQMRRQLLKWVDEHQGDGLKEIVLASIAENRELLRPIELPPPGGPPKS